MNKYKVLMLIAALALIPVVSGYNPSLHKPFIFEHENFKISKTYEEPKHLQTIKLFRIGEAAIEDKQVVVKNQDLNEPVKRPVHIEPSEFYQYASGVNNDSEISRLQGNNSYPESSENNTAQTLEPEELEDIQPQETVEFLSNPVKNKILQRKEETIAWNKWRSDLQNRIMMDAAVDAPLGTLMMFSFKVNKNRQISDIKILCTNPLYQKEASKKIGDAIRSYNGSKIVAFPKNTKRKSVKFDGSYLIWFETEYSTPANFNDLERIHYYE